MHLLAALSKKVSDTPKKDALCIVINAFIMVFKRLDKQFNREATLITIEVLVEHLAELFTLCQLTAINQQVALDQAD